MIEKNKYKGRFCSKPWRFMDIFLDRKADIFSDLSTYICCQLWVKYPIGNPLKDSIEDVWNSEAVKNIRKSILDGTYEYCNKRLCSEIQSGKLPTLEEAMKMENGKYAEIIRNKKIETDIPPDFIVLSYDRTCNLKCISCRKHPVYLTKKQQSGYKILMDKIVNYIQKQDQNHLIKINMSGSGDPFASKVFRNFLFSFNGEKHPNIKICIQTNGILFTENAWNKMKKIHNNVSNVIISLDAGSKEVYDKIRINGDWDKLYENLKFISELKENQKIETVRLDFLVQKKNYKDMAKFVKICKDLKFKPYFSRITSWYESIHFKNDMIFDKHCMGYQDFINTLKNPIFGWKEIDFGNISRFRDIALNELERENKELFLEYKKNMEKEDKRDLKEIWYNYRRYYIENTKLVSLFDTDVVKINKDLIIKYDNELNKWIKCTRKEIKIYNLYLKNL